MKARIVKPIRVEARPIDMGKTFPTLYKKTSTGAIQSWTISVIENPDHSTAYDIWTDYGQVDGKRQTTWDMISEGKNVGKKNETTPRQQAEAEAQAKWEKQLKKGYVQTIEDARDGHVDAIVEGGVVPMLAQKFSEHAHKISYPCFAQPKLDGIRCIAIVKDGACTLWSRTRKPINSMPHIVQELESRFEGMDVILDGELYNHEYKANFEKIVSLVRQEEPDPEHYIVQYHIYDTVNEDVYERRQLLLFRMINLSENEDSALKYVETVRINTEDDVMPYFDKCKAKGYEGAMLRNQDSKYVNKRSYDLQKVKEFDDAEFKIVGAEEGRGKLQGHVGAFVCETKEGKRFLAKMSGDTGKLKEYFNNPQAYVGKKLTVQYQGLTGKEGVPRFPVGLRIRENE